MKKEVNNNNEKKEDDSMNATAIERTGYKRLNFSALNFSENEGTEKKIEEIAPIKWSKEVLSGDKQVLIKKK